MYQNRDSQEQRGEETPFSRQEVTKGILDSCVMRLEKAGKAGRPGGVSGQEARLITDRLLTLEVGLERALQAISSNQDRNAVRKILMDLDRTVWGGK